MSSSKRRFVKVVFYKNRIRWEEKWKDRSIREVYKNVVFYKTK